VKAAKESMHASKTARVSGLFQPRNPMKSVMLHGVRSFFQRDVGR